MNTNDLPLAQKLAALMEAGRAAHPNVRHVRGAWGDGKDKGCAMTYALLGAGLNPEGILNGSLGTGVLVRDELAKVLGVDPLEVTAIMERVIPMNDDTGASLDEIIEAVRTGNFPERAKRAAESWLSGVKLLSMDEFADLPPAKFYFTGALKSYDWISYDPGQPLSIKVEKVGKPFVDKSVRVSAKTGATWPKAKGAY